MTLYSKKDLYEQISFLAYYFHWSLQELLTLTHSDRNRFCQEVNTLNRKANGDSNSIFDV